MNCNNTFSRIHSFIFLYTYVWGCVGSSPNVTVSPGMSLKHFWQKVYLSERRPIPFRLLLYRHHACVFITWTTMNDDQFTRCIQFRQVFICIYWIFCNYTCMQWYRQLFQFRFQFRFKESWEDRSCVFFQLAFSKYQVFRSSRVEKKQGRRQHKKKAANKDLCARAQPMGEDNI